MIMMRFLFMKPLLNSSHRQHHRCLCLLTTESSQTCLTSPSPINEDHLLRVCIVLFQQQDSSDFKLRNKLSSIDFNLTHEFFLQVCNKFPASWRPVHRFFQYTQQMPCSRFTHTSVSFNKMLDIFGKSRNIELLWGDVQEMAKRGLVNDKTFTIVLKTLASARELKKCVEFFHFMNGFGCEYRVERLNKVVENLCKGKLVEEAKFVVLKLKDWIRPDGVTYGWLVKGFCDVGELIEASKIWNLMVEENIELEIEVFEKMMETLFKRNEYDEALKVFQTMKVNRMDDLTLSTYKLVIDWMCRKGKVVQAKMVFDEMRHKGIQADNSTMGSLVYGLLTRGRHAEAHKVVERIEKPDISVYHGLIKGLVRSRRASEATQVFREMINRGCEPTMHTYIMLLQGHLGKRGRKGPDPLVNFESIFVGGLIKAGKSLEATKYVERTMKGSLHVPRFDYNKFLHYYSNEEGAVMFKEVGKKLRETGFVDLSDILQRYGEKMATRERRRNRAVEPREDFLS